MSDAALCKCVGKTQQKIVPVIGQQLRHSLFRQLRGLCFQLCSQFRCASLRQQAADAL